MFDERDTAEARDVARARGYRIREVLPTVDAQERFRAEDFPCDLCFTHDLPHLVDNGCEFYWEHKGRKPCPRFGNGRGPRAGSATSLFHKLHWDGGWVARSEAEYQAAHARVEGDGQHDWYARRPS